MSQASIVTIFSKLIRNDDYIIRNDGYISRMYSMTQFVISFDFFTENDMKNKLKHTINYI